MRALIVDDSAVMRKVIEEPLRQAGLTLIEVLEASNGEEALQILRQDGTAQRTLNIILSDINMPGVDSLNSLSRGLAPGPHPGCRRHDHHRG